MEKDLKIRISIDKNTGELKVVDGEFKKLGKSVKSVNTNTSTLNTSLMNLAKGAVGIYAINEAFSAVMKSGFAFNSQMEQAKAGLTSLAVAVQDKSIPVMERYRKANIEAADTLTRLQKINAQTPHTLDQTNQIYKAMYVSMKNAGASTSDMVEMTRSLSIASGAAGIEFNSLLAGVDGLATGTVLANSDLGRFLSSLGLTNEALKKSDDVVSLVTNKMKDFKAAGTMAESMSNLENAWDSLAGSLTKDIFEDAKGWANDLSKALNEIVEAREKLSPVENKRKQFSLLDDMKEAAREVELYTDRVDQASKHTETWWDKTFGTSKANTIAGYNEQLKEQQTELESLSKEYADLFKVISDGKEKTAKKGKTLTDEEIKKEEKARTKSINKIFGIMNKQTETYWDNVELQADNKADVFSKNIQDYIKTLAEFNKFDPEFDDKPTKKKAEKTFETDWGVIISNTFTEGMQDAFNGDFNLGKLTSSLGNSVGSAISSAGMGQATKKMTASLNLGTGVAGGLATAGVGFAISGASALLTRGLERASESSDRLNKSIKDLEDVNKKLIEASQGEGSKLADILALSNGLNNAVSTSYNAKEAYKNSYADEIDTVASETIDALLAWGTLGLSEYFDFGDKILGWFGRADTKQQDLQSAINESIVALQNQAIAVIDSADAINSYSDTFKNLYDSLTNNSYFSDKSGKEALSTTNKLAANNGYTDIASLLMGLSTKYNIPDLEQFKKDLAKPVDTKDFQDALIKSTNILDDFGISGINMVDTISEAVTYQKKLNDLNDKSIANIKELQLRNETPREKVIRLANDVGSAWSTDTQGIDRIVANMEKSGGVFTDEEKKAALAMYDYADSIIANRKAVEDAIKGQEYGQAQFIDSLNGTATALDYAKEKVGMLGKDLPTTTEKLITLRQSFIDNDGVIDTYEQAVIDATLATKPFSDSINGTTESLKKATQAQLDHNKALLDAQTNSIKSTISNVTSLLSSVGSSVNNIYSSIDSYNGKVTTLGDVRNAFKSVDNTTGSAKYDNSNKFKSVIDSYYGVEESKIKKLYSDKIEGLNSEQDISLKNYQTRYDALKAEQSAISSINNSVKSLKEYATSLLITNSNLSPTATMSMYSNLFSSSYTNLQSAINSNNVDGVNTFSADARNYAQSYIDSAKVGTSSRQQYDLIVGGVAGRLNALNTKQETTLGDVNDGLNNIRETFKKQIESLQSHQTLDITKLKKESVTWLEKVKDELVVEQERLQTVDETLREKFTDMYTPLSNMEIALKELDNKTLNIETVQLNIDNTAKHQSRLETLIKQLGEKLDKLNNTTATVAENTETNDTFLVDGVAV